MRPANAFASACQPRRRGSGRASAPGSCRARRGRRSRRTSARARRRRRAPADRRIHSSHHSTVSSRRHALHRPGRVLLGVRRRAPARFHRLELALELVATHPPGIVGRPRDARRGVHQREPQRPLGVRGREEARERPAVRDRRRRVRARCRRRRARRGRSSMRSSIGGSRRIAQAVGEAHAAAVEADDRPQRPSAAYSASIARTGGGSLQSEAEDVRTDAEHVDAARAVTVDPVGDVDVAAPRVPDARSSIGCHGLGSPACSSQATGRCSRGRRRRSRSSRHSSRPPVSKWSSARRSRRSPPRSAAGCPIYAQNVHWAAEGAFTGEISAADAARARRRGGDRRAFGAAPVLRRDGRHRARAVRGGARGGAAGDRLRRRDRGRARGGGDRRGAPAAGRGDPRGTTRS